MLTGEDDEDEAGPILGGWREHPKRLGDRARCNGIDEVSWARRQIEQELSPSSRGVAPCGVVWRHPSAAGSDRASRLRIR